MLLLVIVSLIWAFSFGLIKRHLIGVDSTFVATARLGLAMLVFLPFLRLRGVAMKTLGCLALIGTVQFGVMYLAYIESFRYLKAYEVGLFTITTPIFVTLLADAFDRTWRIRALAAAVLAVLGTALIMVKSADVTITLRGFALVQLSNAAFAFGQVLYRRVRAGHPGLRDRDVFAVLYGCAFFVAAIAMVAKGVSVTLSTPQVWTLLYLGVLASGVGFFLWNVGATQVSSGTLAVMNNAKVPLAVLVSLFVFGEQAPLLWLVASLATLGVAVWVAAR